LQGTWQIVTLIDDGEVVPASTVKNLLVKDGCIHVRGNNVTLTRGRRLAGAHAWPSPSTWLPLLTGSTWPGRRS